MKLPPLFSLSLVLALSACSASQGDRGYLASADGILSDAIVGGPRSNSPQQAEISSKFMLVLPAEAGAPKLLTEKPYADGWRQSVSLDNAKVAGDWNDLAIDMRFDGGARAGAKIPMGPPSQDGIKREILSRFPGTPMHIVGRSMSNAIGPFGLAVGAAGSVRCAFAWQWVDDLRGSRSSEFGGLLLTRATPASIRMRICRSGVTADQLAGWIEQLTLADISNLDRIIAEWKQGGESAPAQSAPGVAAPIVAPAASPGVAATEVVGGTTLESSLVGSRAAPAATAAKVASAPQHRRHYAAAPRRTARRAHQQQEAAEPETAVAPAAAVPPQGGRQYLAPVDSSTAQYGAPQPSGGAGFGQARLDPGLPAQAYRGPTAAQTRAAVVSGNPSGPRYLGAVGQ